MHTLPSPLAATLFVPSIKLKGFKPMDNPEINYKWQDLPKCLPILGRDPNPTVQKSRFTLALTQRSEKIPPIINTPDDERCKSRQSKNNKSRTILDLLILREERQQQRENTVPGTPLFHPDNFV